MDKDLKILILEDNPADAELSEHELKRAGIEFGSRRVETMEAFERELGAFAPDAVISDYNLPGFTGMDAFRAFSGGGHYIPFILVTGALKEEKAAECLTEGMDDYILKGNLSRLPSALERALERKEAERERKAALERLKESEERHRRTLEGMIEGCQIIGHDWSYLFVNDAAATHGRRKKDELLGHTMMECYPGIEKTDVFAELQRCMNDQTSHRMENEFSYPDGSKAWFLLSIQPVPEGIFILSLDITEQKKAEKRLKNAEQRFRSIFDNTLDGILVADLERKMFSAANNAACSMLGYSRKEINKLGVMDIHPEKDLPYVIDQFERQARGEFSLARDIPVRRKDGAVFYADINSSVVEICDEKYLLGVFRDISERKKKEEEMAKYIDELERFQAATVQREFRVKELREENEKLKARIEALETKSKAP